MFIIGLFKRFYDYVFQTNEEAFVSDFIELSDKAYKNHLKEGAIHTVLGKIHSACELVEFDTSDKKLSYRLNVKPNDNENATEFRRRLIDRLILDGECLVIVENGKFYIADSFVVNDTVLSDRKYTEITVGNINWNKYYYEREVFHFTYHNRRFRSFVNQLNKSYGDLFSRMIEVQMREQQLRIFAKFKTMTSKENRDKFSEYLKNLEHQLKTSSVVVSPHQDGYDLTEKMQSYVGRPVVEVGDIENLYIKTVANALQVPPLLFSGDLADVSQHNENFINHCIKYLMSIITTEINAKYFNQEELTEPRKRLSVNLIDAIYTSELAMAKDVEKMIGTGVWTIDDVRDLQGKERLNTVISTQHYLTKNLAPLAENGALRKEE